MDVTPLRVGPELARVHVFDHALAQRAVCCSSAVPGQRVVRIEGCWPSARDRRDDGGRWTRGPQDRSILSRNMPYFTLFGLAFTLAINSGSAFGFAFDVRGESRRDFGLDPARREIGKRLLQHYLMTSKSRPCSRAVGTSNEGCQSHPHDAGLDQSAAARSPGPGKGGIRASGTLRAVLGAAVPVASRGSTVSSASAPVTSTSDLAR